MDNVQKHNTFTIHKYDLNVCDDGILIKLLWFWTLSIVLFLFKANTTFRRLDSVSVFRWNFQFHASAASPSEKQTPYPLDTGLNKPQNRPASYAEDKNLFLLSGIEPRSTDNYILNWSTTKSLRCSQNLAFSYKCFSNDAFHRLQLIRECTFSITGTGSGTGCGLRKFVFSEWTDACLEGRLYMYFLLQWWKPEKLHTTWRWRQYVSTKLW
jgi:hypothetical protein